MNFQSDIQDLAFAMRGHVMAGNFRRADELADHIDHLQAMHRDQLARDTWPTKRETPEWAEVWRIKPRAWMDSFPHAYLQERTFYAPVGADEDEAARYACHAFRRGGITADDVELIDCRVALAALRGVA